MASRALFPPWEAPPAFAPCPTDEALAQRISKLVKFVVRIGAEFEQLMRQKQHDNPDYSFLFGGDGNLFYKWTLYCALHNLSPHTPSGSTTGTTGCSTLDCC